MVKITSSNVETFIDQTHFKCHGVVAEIRMNLTEQAIVGITDRACAETDMLRQRMHAQRANIVGEKNS